MATMEHFFWPQQKFRLYLKLFVLWLGLSVVCFGASAGKSARAQEGPPWQVVATIAQVADAVRQVAGERAEVTTLMGEGVDPHTYRQTRSDITRLSRADIIFWNGLYLEAQMESLLRTLARTKPVVALGERLPAEKLLGNEDYAGKFDPHIWMDVALWVEVVETLREALIEFDPDGAGLYRANAKAYIERLQALQAYAQEALATVPEEQRALITAHDAFNYFGAAYDFEVLGIQGLSTESEAGLARIEQLVNLIVERDIGAVFVETSVADRNVRALIEGAAARGHKVVIGGELFSDAMGPPNSYEGSYIGMIDHNVTVIARALGGEAPAGGLNGKLTLE